MSSVALIRFLRFCEQIFSITIKDTFREHNRIFLIQISSIIHWERNRIFPHKFNYIGYRKNTLITYLTSCRNPLFSERLIVNSVSFYISCHVNQLFLYASSESIISLIIFEEKCLIGYFSIWRLQISIYFWFCQ